MRLLPLKMCRPGMVLGKKIYNEAGLVLLGNNVELTEGLIKRLEQGGIDQLYVQDARTEDLVIIDPIRDETRLKAMTEIRTKFRGMMDDSSPRRKGLINPYFGRDFKNLLTMIIDDLGDHKNAMLMLNSISVKDHYLYEHSLNVCLYTVMLGMASGYTKDELTVLGLGAMLHDVGKTQIPMEILKKPGNLTESEFTVIKGHAEIGYKLLKDMPNIPLITAHCAFQHHERLDGSGYPRKLEGDKIHEYAKWIGLVDSFDAMTTHRIYRKAMLPHQAIEVLYAGSGTLYDKKMIECFRDKVAIYPLGITVQISTREVGIVVDINSTAPQRPIIRIIQDAEGQELSQTYEIDLSKRLNIMITSVNDIMVEQES